MLADYYGSRRVRSFRDADLSEQPAVGEYKEKLRLNYEQGLTGFDSGLAITRREAQNNNSAAQEALKYRRLPHGRC